jgi:hypothetical protein
MGSSSSLLLATGNYTAMNALSAGKRKCRRSRKDDLKTVHKASLRLYGAGFVLEAAVCGTAQSQKLLKHAWSRSFCFGPQPLVTKLLLHSLETRA